MLKFNEAEREEKMDKMNFEKLTEKLITLETGYSGILNHWLTYEHYTNDERFNIIYGFIRGLAATGFISSKEEDELIDLLLNSIYPEFEKE